MGNGPEPADKLWSVLAAPSDVIAKEGRSDTRNKEGTTATTGNNNSHQIGIRRATVFTPLNREAATYSPEIRFYNP